ncbi:MFS general substrate transporter [Lentinula aciculospora]|uniref:MFS general substrate transporter n=1 Tax=Lentinula aciculospora TaxID=153920 RepID=A0A9W9AAR6_9AGAR|nr:MFS general substrate transporter [Lentinula aciculospora]
MSSAVSSHTVAASSSTEQGKDPESPLTPLILPNGGWQAWATVFGAFLVQVCNFGYTSSFGVYQDFYVQEYITNASPSAISWIGSVNAFCLISGGVIAGRLYDRGYFYPLVWGGSLLTVFSLFMLSLAKPNHYYQVFLSQGLGAGLGGGLTYVPSIAITSHYFSTRRALAMTIIATGSSLGAIIHPIMLNNTFARLGFHDAVCASTGLVAGLLLIACCLMRTNMPIQQHYTRSLQSISSDWAYISATLGLMSFSIGFYFPQFYLQLDASIHGLNKDFAFYSLVVLNSASIVGRLLPGFLVNKLGAGNMITFATAMCAAAISGMIGLSSTTSVVLIAIFYGFFAGTYVGLISPLMVSLSSDVSEIGLRMGIGFLFSGIGVLIGTPIGGVLLTERFIWWQAVLFSGMTGMLGSFFFAGMLVILHQRRNSKNTEKQ